MHEAARGCEATLIGDPAARIAASCLISGYKVIQRFIEIECTQNLTTPGDLSFPETGFIAL